jgi:hypothetical protein
MKTRPPPMAAEDFTGPLVLNDHSNAGLSGRVPVATPVSDGLPRDMGQSAAAAVATASHPLKPA